jgi:hypothetical protein
LSRLLAGLALRRLLGLRFFAFLLHRFLLKGNVPARFARQLGRAAARPVESCWARGKARRGRLA